MVRKKIPAVTIDEAIQLLNEANQADPEAISAVFGFKFPCNRKLRNHKTIQVAFHSKEIGTIGMLGILNGIFGVSKKRKGWGYICMVVDTETGAIVKFERTPGTL